MIVKFKNHNTHAPVNLSTNCVMRVKIVPQERGGIQVYVYRPEEELFVTLEIWNLEDLIIEEE